MPRVRKRQSAGNVYKTKYTHQDLANAVSAVQSGASKSWKAAKDYGIPKGTVTTKLNTSTLESLDYPLFYAFLKEH